MSYDQIRDFCGVVPCLLMIAVIGAVYVHELISDGKRNQDGAR
jgi:hypothetical protein